YLMSTGRRPFEAPTDLEAVLRVRQCDFPAPETIKPDIAPQLAAVIMRAMRLGPAERYQSAEEMLIAIESVQRTVFQPAGQTSSSAGWRPCTTRTRSPRSAAPLRCRPATSPTSW